VLPRTMTRVTPTMVDDESDADSDADSDDEENDDEDDDEAGDGEGDAVHGLGPENGEEGTSKPEGRRVRAVCAQGDHAIGLATTQRQAAAGAPCSDVQGLWDHQLIQNDGPVSASGAPC